MTFLFYFLLQVHIFTSTGLACFDVSAFRPFPNPSARVHIPTHIPIRATYHPNTHLPIHPRYRHTNDQTDPQAEGNRPRSRTSQRFKEPTNIPTSQQKAERTTDRTNGQNNQRTQSVVHSARPRTNYRINTTNTTTPYTETNQRPDVPTHNANEQTRERPSGPLANVVVVVVVVIVVVVVVVVVATNIERRHGGVVRN